MKQIKGFPNYYADVDGNIYRKDMSIIKPFNSNGYYQVYLKNEDGKRHILGVHQVIAMTYIDDYYDGCVVHHIDNNKHNNSLSNLQIFSKSDHSRHHANPESLIKAIRENGPPNKGKKMSSEFCLHCKLGALRRHKKLN